jgi:tetratricopeptide (TPR) repeat protein
MIRIVIAALLFATSSASAANWYDHYEKGVRLIEQGRGEEAREALTAALAGRADEGVQLPTGQQQYIDYLPHLYLAIANQMAGDVEKARKELGLAETSGMAAKSEVGRPLLVAYELLLRGDATGKYPQYTVYEKKAPTLSEAEFTLLRNDVLTKCDLPLDTKLGAAPWYANYELGLQLERKGDYSRALTHFIDAVAQLLPVLSHRPLARAPRELAVRKERAGDLAAADGDSGDGGGAHRVAVAAAGDGAGTGDRPTLRLLQP